MALERASHVHLPVRLGVRRTSALLSLLLAVGCEEPRFTDSADASLQTNCDATQCPASSSLVEAGASDDPRTRWEGHYAARTHLYLVDGLLNTDAELLTLVDIKRDGNRLVMEQQLCLYDGGWNAVLVLGRLRYEYPNLRARAKVTFDGEHFSTEALISQLGMGEPPAACSGSSTAPASPEQRWLSGTCDCPKPNTVPANARDCRVTDPDNDSHPGFTTRGLVNADTWSYYITQQQRIRYLAGYREADRLYASVEHQDKTQTHGCGDKSPVACPVGAEQSCPAKYNLAELVPVAADVDCARVISQADLLFRLPRQPFSPSCKNELTNPSSSP